MGNDLEQNEISHSLESLPSQYKTVTSIKRLLQLTLHIAEARGMTHWIKRNTYKKFLENIIKKLAKKVLDFLEVMIYNNCVVGKHMRV